MKHLVFLDSVSFILCALRKLPKTFGLEVTKSLYSYYINTEENLDNLGPMPDITYYSMDEMSGRERKEFLPWYERHKSEPIDNRRLLESYCQDDVTFIRQACREFRRECLQIENIEVFLDSHTIVYRSNKVLRHRFLKPDTIGLIPTGVHNCNNKYGRKAIICHHMEQTNGDEIKHTRNGREYSLPELPDFSLVGYCAETNTIYEYYGCHRHSHASQHFRDVTTTNGNTLAARYELTMLRLE